MLVIFRPVPEPNTNTPPRVWVIAAYRAGEQSQLLALAEALGWPFEVKQLRHRWQGALFNLVRGTGLQCSVRTTRGIDISAACGQLGKAAEGMRHAS